MRRQLAIAVAIAAAFAVPAPALADHSGGRAPQSQPTAGFMSGGQGARWEHVRSFSSGNLQSDLEFFKQGAETYMSAGTLAVGQNGGQSIYRVTRDGGATIDPTFVSNHPSATCVSNPSAALGLQHDVEASPKGIASPGDVLYPAAASAGNAVQADTQVLIDATDGRGRCHDQGVLGIDSAPLGGLEIIDVSNPDQTKEGSLTRPKEIGLTVHVGQAHTVNVDPKRPHIVYAVTSDGVGVNAQGQRANDTSTTNNSLDGFEVVNIKSCLTAPLGTIPADATIAQKRESCRPEVFRFRYPSTDLGLGHTIKTQIFGCHETEIYPDDRLTCGGGAAAIVFDMKGAFNDMGTPADFTDDVPRGTPLPCRIRNSSSTPGFQTAAKVTDCSADPTNKSLTVGAYPEGNNSLAGVRHIGSAFHIGRAATAETTIPSTEDVDFNHETEFTGSGKFLLATDERGGGVVPPGASCTSGADNTQGNGGVHAYAVDRLKLKTPLRAESDESYARTREGRKAIFRARVRTGGEATECTAHVMQQIPGQNRIFMGWYSQGTQVIDFTENADGTFEFTEAGFFIPPNANNWTSAVYRVQENADGTFTYHGAATDFALGDNGRNSIEFYKLTLGAPQKAGELAPTPPGTTGGVVPGGVVNPPAPRTFRGRRFLISRRSKRQDRKGFVKVVVSCRQESPCRGTIRLRTAKRFRSGRKVSRVVLGSRTFSVPARRRSTLRVRVTAASRRLLRQQRALRILAIANVRPEAGASSTRRFTDVASFRLVRAR